MDAADRSTQLVAGLGPPRQARLSPTTEYELRAQRLGSALRGLATELVDERRRVARLRLEIAGLKARLEALESARPGPGDLPPANDT